MTAVEKFKEEAGKVWRLGRRVRYYSAECQRETILWQLAAALTSNPAENEMVESLSAILGQYLRSPGVFIAMPQNGKTLHLYPLKSGRSLQRWLWGKVALPAMRMGQWSQWKVSLDHPDNLLARSFRERAVLFETQPGMLLIGGEPGINQARLKCVYKLHLHPVRGAVVLPLIYEDQVLGVLAVFCYQKVNVLPPENVDFLRSAARLVALAIGNARLYRQIYRDKLEVEARLSRIKRLRFQAVQFEEQALLGQMAGKVAHDLNNPLAAILGFFQQITDQGFVIYNKYPGHSFLVHPAHLTSLLSQPKAAPIPAWLPPGLLLLEFPRRIPGL